MISYTGTISTTCYMIPTCDRSYMSKGQTANELREIWKQLNEQYTELSAKYEAQHLKVQQTQKRRIVLQNMVTSLQETKTSLMASLDNISFEESKFRYLIDSDFQKSKKMKQKEIEEAKRDLQEIQQTYDLVKMRRQYLQESYEEAAKKYDNQIEELQLNIQITRAKQEEIRQRISTLDQLYVSKQKKNPERLSSINPHQVKENIIKANKEIDVSKIELFALQSQLDTLKAECKELHAKVNKQKKPT